jgi:uncharacterized protein
MIDAHCHIGPGLRAAIPFGPVFATETGEQLLALLDAAEIERAVVMAPSWEGGWDGAEFADPDYRRANQAIAAEVQRHPDRLIGVGRVNPKFGAEAVRELERCLTEYGFRGLKLNNEADGFEPTNLRLLSPLAEVCVGHGAPMLVRTGFHPSEPLLFLPLAQAHPDLKVVLLHMGGRVHSDAIITAQQAPNVYLETAAQMPRSIVAAVQALGADRVIFGTDTPYAIPEVEVRRIQTLGLGEDELRKITRDNVHGLLGLTERVSSP